MKCASWGWASKNTVASISFSLPDHFLWGKPDNMLRGYSSSSMEWSMPQGTEASYQQPMKSWGLQLLANEELRSLVTIQWGTGPAVTSQWGTEAAFQQSASTCQAYEQPRAPAPVKPSQGCSSGWHLDYSSMGDPGPGPSSQPIQSSPQTLCEMINVYCCSQLLSFG